MAWIGQDFEELRVSVRTADILRWAGIFSGDAGDRGCRGSLQMPIFDDRDVMPVVAEVVDVVEAARLESERIEKDDLRLVDVPKFLGPIGIRIGILDATDDELVQVTVGPAERGLDRPIELRQLDGLGNDQATPDRRHYIQQLDLQLPG